MDAFDTAAPPSNSYAYVHSAAATSAASAAARHRRASPPPTPAPSPSSQTLVTVEGEPAPVAAAPGAVRRALRQHSTGSTTKGDTATAAAAAGLPHTDRGALQQLLKSRPEEAREASALAKAAAAVALSPTERRARRERQRQTREARVRRRHERTAQSSGAALHPCRLQGGCRHSLSVDGTTAAAAVHCPYRHVPATRCLAELREGRCALHRVGCCPWTHEAEESATAVGADTHPGLWADVSPFAPPQHLPVSEEEVVAAVQRSAEKVGRLLRLCVDAVVAAFEDESAAEPRRVLLDTTADLPLRWRAVAAVLQGQHPQDAASGGGVVAVEAIEVGAANSGEERVLCTSLLSVQADLAWCAVQDETETDGAGSAVVLESFDNPYEAEVRAMRGTVDLPPRQENAALSSEECEYWSSFFTCESSTASAAPPRVVLTPCVSAWVLDAAAVQLSSPAAAAASSSPCNTVDGDQDAVVPMTARRYFQQATLYLLGWRQAELHRFQCSTNPQLVSAVGTVEGGETALMPARSSVASRVDGAFALSWAPVLLLRDLLMASCVAAARSGAAEMTDDLARLSGGSSSSSGAAGDEVVGDVSPLPSCARDSLLALFLDLVPRGAHDDEQREEAQALVRRGSHFASARLLARSMTTTTASPAGNTNAACSSAHAVLPGSASASSRTSPNSAAAFQTAFDAVWTTVHDAVVQLQYGLLRCHGLPPQPAATTSTRPPPLSADPSKPTLALFLQPAVVRVAASVSTAFAACYEHQLRAFAGWQPWTDQQLFVKAHAAVYNAASYARHHLPVVRLGVHNSLLNSLLLLSTAHTSSVFQLDEPSEARQLLLRDALGPHQDGSCNNAVAASASSAAESWNAAQRLEPSHRQQLLQPFLSLSLGYLGALQELSQHHLALRQALMLDYEQRRTARELADAAENTHAAQRGSTQRFSVASSGTVNRTRKYNSPSADAQQAAQRRRLEELRGVALLDRLLPHGTPTVCPEAAAALLRHLLEGGSPYKAMKLAAAMVHASRMLRHADKQPRPVLQQGSRTVHTRVWSRRLLRHVLVKKKVPVLRIVGDVEAEMEGGAEDAEGAPGKPGARARRAVRPVGLVFALSGTVVAEVARVGLRMGEAGATLVDGVQQDCLRGALIDFCDGRGLPVPTLADVQRAVRGSGREAHLPAAHHRCGSDGGGDSLRGRRVTPSSAGALLQLVGTASASSSSPHRRSLLTSEEEGRGAPHRRIAPSPLLLEVLQGHTPPSDTTRHTEYLRFLLQDVTRFSTWSVLLSLQYQACHAHSRYATARLSSSAGAARAMQTVYAMTAPALCEAGRDSNKGFTRTESSVPSTAAASERETALLTPHGRGSEDGLLHLLAQEAEAGAAEVREWVLHDAASVGRGGQDVLHTPTKGALAVSDVKSLLSRAAGDVLEATLTEGSDEGERKQQQQLHTRRAKLPLPVLMHHIWSTAVVKRSPAQRCTALWAICVATLLGTTSASLRHAVGSGRSGVEGEFLCRPLHHSYVAAGVLMRRHTPQQAKVYVDATVKALLLSPALLPAEEGAALAPVRASSTAAEWPMALSSAYRATIHTLHEFVCLQFTLLTALLTETETLMEMRAEAQGFVDAFTTAHGDLSVGVREWPAWRLYEPILRQPALAQHWLYDAFLCPSASLLAWVVAAVSRTDVAGYAVLCTWLQHLSRRPQLSASVLRDLGREAERRHKGALTRQRHTRHSSLPY